ncbi:MAG: hypothetical protein ACI4WS_00095 [Oscillospiraceae bacterium]
MMIKRRISAALLCGALMTAACGCEGADGAQSGNADEHITVYLWETRLFDEFAGYVGEGYALKDIEVNAAPIDNSAVYKLLVQMEIEAVFADACPGAELQPLDATLCDVWSEVTGGGGQPAQPEDYIELVK